MQINFNSERAIFLQVAEGIEEGILSGAYPEQSQVPSTTEISVRYKINPATALKGVNLLVEEGILYKKRGLGMFVCEGAQEALQKKRKVAFFEEHIATLVREACRLGIDAEELVERIKISYHGGEQ